MNYLWVGLGGMIGSICRYGIWRIHKDWTKPVPAGDTEWVAPFLPWPTLIVNIVGCLAIGFLWRHLGPTIDATNALRCFVLTGFLGGFTTFSTFGIETQLLVQDGHTGRAISYVLISLIGGMLAVIFGFQIAKLMGAAQ